MQKRDVIRNEGDTISATTGRKINRRFDFKSPVPAPGFTTVVFQPKLQETPESKGAFEKMAPFLMSYSSEMQSAQSSASAATTQENDISIQSPRQDAFSYEMPEETNLLRRRIYAGPMGAHTIFANREASGDEADATPPVSSSPMQAPSVSSC